MASRNWMGSRTKKLGSSLASGDTPEFLAWMATVEDNESYKKLLREHEEYESGLALWNDLTEHGRIINPYVRLAASIGYRHTQKSIIEHKEKKSERLIYERTNPKETVVVSDMITVGRDGVMRNPDGSALSKEKLTGLVKDGALKYQIPVASQHVGFAIHGQTYVMGENGGLFNQRGQLYGGDKVTATIARLAAEQALFTANRERGNVDCPASINAMIDGVRDSASGGLSRILTSEQKTPIEHFLRDMERRGVREAGKVNPNDLDQIKDFLKQQGMGRLIAHIKKEEGAPIVRIDGKSVRDFVWEASAYKKILESGDRKAICEAVSKNGGDPNRLFIAATGEFLEKSAEDFLKTVVQQKVKIDNNSSPQAVNSWLRANEAILQKRGIDINNVKVEIIGNQQAFSIGYESAHPGFDMDRRAANFFKLCYKAQPDGSFALNQQFVEMLPPHIKNGALSTLSPNAVTSLMAVASNIDNATTSDLYLLRRSLDAVLNNLSPGPFPDCSSLQEKLNDIFKSRGGLPLQPNDLVTISRALNNDGSVNEGNLSADATTAAHEMKILAFLKSISDEDRYALRLACDEDRARYLNILDSSARIQESPEWQNMFAKQVIISSGTSDLAGKDFDRNNPAHGDALMTTLTSLIPKNSSTLQLNSPEWGRQPEWLRNALLSAPPEKILELGNKLHNDKEKSTNIGEITKIFSSLVAPHFASVLSDPEVCKIQMEEAKKAIRSGDSYDEKSIFVPLMKKGAGDSWILNEDLVARAMDTSRLIAYQAESLHIREAGFMETYKAAHSKTLGLQSESNWMANYSGHVNLIQVGNSPADTGAIIVDHKAKVAFNMELDHPPADRLIKNNGDFRHVVDFLSQMPEHSTIVDAHYIHNDRGLCFNQKVAYTELEDTLERHAGLAEKLGITLHHRVNGIAPNSLNHMEGEAQRLQEYMRDKFEYQQELSAEAARKSPSPSGP
ncbi:MAG: hypothetical protein IKZ87_04200 [Actinomycetaceae bacterium]|nr:hypothetical protein [Actinomycetaceae bacterium]